jgi:hypothetical protein
MATLRAPQAHYKREGRSVILADGTALILVDRLRAVFWPRIVRTWMTDTRDVLPQMDYVAESSRRAHKDYDRGRILHFVNLLAHGKPLDPIYLTCLTFPRVHNGWHRYAAAVLLGAPTIRAEIWSGHYSTSLQWLTGVRHLMPNNLRVLTRYEDEFCPGETEARSTSLRNEG